MNNRSEHVTNLALSTNATRAVAPAPVRRAQPSGLLVALLRRIG